MYDLIDNRLLSGGGKKAFQLIDNYLLNLIGD